jgi:hypothetical protein
LFAALIGRFFAVNKNNFKGDLHQNIANQLNHPLRNKTGIVLVRERSWWKKWRYRRYLLGGHK